MQQPAGVVFCQFGQRGSVPFRNTSIPGAAELLHGADNLAQLVVEVVGEDEVDGLDLAEVLAVGQRVRVWKIRQVDGGGRLKREEDI